MAEKRPQTFANHGRSDLLYQFFALPIFGLSVLWSVVHFIRHPGLHSAIAFIVLTAATVVALKTRTYSLRMQDRVIRLEERLRLATILAEPLRSRIPELTETQLIGLRFASDAELSGLCERVLNENLSRTDIKKAIENWRPDYWRV
jgi:hypothetical protein